MQWNLHGHPHLPNSNKGQEETAKQLSTRRWLTSPVFKIRTEVSHNCFQPLDSRTLFEGPAVTLDAIGRMSSLTSFTFEFMATLTDLASIS